MDTIPKKLNFEVDPNLDTTWNLDDKYMSYTLIILEQEGSD